MAAFLSDEWFAALHADAVDLDDCMIEITVIGAPPGDVKWHVQVSSGRLDAAGGAAPDAEIVLALPYDDTIAVARGELAPSVAFMRGRMKTAGDPGRLLDVLAATARPEFQASRDALAAATEF